MSSSLKLQVLFHHILYGSFCLSGTNNLFKGFCTIKQNGCQYMVKTLQNFRCYIPRFSVDTRSTKFVQMMILERPLNFFIVLSNFCCNLCGKTRRILYSVCRYAMAVLHTWANQGPWASCLPYMGMVVILFNIYGNGGHLVQWCGTTGPTCQ